MRKTRIAEVCEQSTMQALVVSGSTPLEDVIERMAAAYTRHGIFLTDGDGRLQGVVNNSDLRDWARLQFDVPPSDHPISVGKVRRLLGAITIADLAMPESREMSVRLEDTLDVALNKMSQYGLEDIAVLDGNGRVVNDLRLPEVLAYALRVRRSRAQDT